MAFDDPAVILNVVTLLALVVALGFGLKQARDFERKRREDATMRVLESLMTNQFAAQILRVQDLDGPVMPSARATLTREQRLEVIQFAQQMETLGVLVADRVIEIDIVEKALGSFVTDAWEKQKPAVLGIREETGDAKIAEYFQWLAEQIERRARERPTRPAYEGLPGW